MAARRTSSFEPETDDRRVAAYLGLPSDHRFDMARMPEVGGHSTGEYALAHWGTLVDWDVAMDGEPPWPFATARVINSGVCVVAEDGTHEARPGPSVPVTFQLWLIQCYRPGHPLAAERRWHPDLGVRDSIIGLTAPHAEADVLAAWRGRALIAGYLETETRRGRRLLEESPTSPWRHFAERATELLKTGEVATVRDAAARLMVDYDSLSDDPRAETKAELAAERRLYRYIERLGVSPRADE